MIGKFEDFEAQGKANLDAAAVSTTALNDGIQTIAAEIADFSQKTFHGGTKAVEEAMTATSLSDAVEIQMAYARGAYAAYADEFTKLGKLYADTARKACQPFETQLAKSTKQTAKNES